jgi:murein DD-endopeptidase MepM/ murein hydrolase activator NlpD
MRFPLNDYNYQIPTGEDLGAFGVFRKFDRHTGVDLYCQQGDDVLAMEDGEIIAIEWFTGPSVNMPWWNDTLAVSVKGESGIINYCELLPNPALKVGDKITEGTLIGLITPVLRVDKGKVPSTSMLHLELYSEYNGKWVMWELDQPKPSNLMDPTDLILKSLLV